MKIKFLFISIVFVFLFSCGNNANQQTVNSPSVVVKAVDSVAKTQKEVIKINRSYDDIGRYIAGLNSLSGNTLNENLYNNDWKNFANDFSNRWKKYDTTHLNSIKKWRDEELIELNKNTSTIFYPFSGPDILNAYTLFPHAKTFVMVGLEPVGTLPDLQNNKDSLNNYFKSVNESLYAILNFSFFRTIAMKNDLNKPNELNGTIHLILLFLERTGNKIADVKPVNISADGTLKYYENFNLSKSDSLRSKGAEISFIDADSILKKVYYFSTNLVNNELQRNKGFEKYVSSLGAYSTYLKSASYLMYESYFSYIRNIILNGSKTILQDDSGIPLHYFKEKNNFDLVFYGTYTKPINLFKNSYQDDLYRIYNTKDSIQLKNLPFGIGYKFHKGESNLMLAKRKN